MQTPLERLAARLERAIRLLESGQLTLEQACEVVRSFRHITISQVGDLFPPEPTQQQRLQGMLSMMDLLGAALWRYQQIGVPASTRLRDIPLLTAGIRTAVQAALDGKPGAISFL
ncbi:hypothetical protein [Chromobacterium haemolyticum]|uniref:hypothetical protein n=1 Tax=Chromobacterium haemolyticum TaxID=394935 RepID=UPI00244CFE19|nr:hypothetical protein [Chromobacterium haemolyticum]MDH0342107.1 hypothetical protein [Chromobacterium haemolyticum]